MGERREGGERGREGQEMRERGTGEGEGSGWNRREEDASVKIFQHSL